MLMLLMLMLLMLIILMLIILMLIILMLIILMLIILMLTTCWPTYAVHRFMIFLLQRLAPTGASLHLRLPLRRRRPGAEYADCIYGSDCADCSPRFPPLPPSAPRRATGLQTSIATTAAPARSSARPRADGTWTGPSRHITV